MGTQSNIITIVKSNVLVEASYKIGLQAGRVALLSISKLVPKMEMYKQKTCRIYAKEFGTVFGIDEKNAYAVLKKGIDELYKASITTWDVEKGHSFRWIESKKYHKGKGYVELIWTNSIAPHITNINKHFTKYEFLALTSAKSIYAVRFFELFKRWKKKGERYIDLPDLRKWLELETKYLKYANFKARVIEPAILDLEKNANLTISWEEVKEGKKVIGFEFMYEVDNQMQLPFDW